MKLFSYTITRDFGFAPNPFGGVCTLATCKPLLRKRAHVGEWVMGTGAVTNGLKGQLIYAMRIDEKISFDEYWNDPRFINKRPVFNSSLKHSFGDNIYHRDAEGKWMQENSHHSLDDGTINEKNLKTDTRWPLVLISNHFFYYGDTPIALPLKWVDELCHNKRVPPHKEIEGKIVERFINWLEQQHRILGIPREFKNGFARFQGE